MKIRAGTHEIIRAGTHEIIRAGTHENKGWNS